MPRKKAPIPTELLTLRDLLSEYRSRHRPRTPLPEDLWKEAVTLAAKHGLHRTARTLPVDYANLKKRMGASSKSKAPRRTPAFVELVAATTQPPAAGTMVELLRIESPGPVDWAVRRHRFASSLWLERIGSDDLPAVTLEQLGSRALMRPLLLLNQPTRCGRGVGTAPVRFLRRCSSRHAGRRAA